MMLTWTKIKQTMSDRIALFLSALKDIDPAQTLTVCFILTVSVKLI